MDLRDFTASCLGGIIGALLLFYPLLGFSFLIAVVLAAYLFYKYF